MKRAVIIVVLAAVLALAAASPVFAQGKGQTDITLQVPYRFGIVDEGSDYSDVAKYAFLIPELRMAYYFGNDLIKVGPGIRLFTVIVESVVYPLVSVELDLDPVVINANVGGYAFFFFGLYNDIGTGGVYLPELSIAYKLTDTIRLGTGAILFTAPEATDDFDSFGYIGTVFMRFTF